MSEQGDWLARHLAENADTQHLRDLCDQIKDPKQLQLISEGLFEEFGVVDKLAFIGEFGGTPQTLGAEREDGPIERKRAPETKTLPTIPYMKKQR